MDIDIAPSEQLDTGLSRVVTLTAAPAIDRVYMVDAMLPGSVIRAGHVQSFLAGKGINVAKTLQKAGNETIAVAPMNLEDSLSVLEDPQLYRTVNVSAPTRVNTVIVGGDGSTTNINQSPPALTSDVWLQLCAASGSEIRRIKAHWLVVAGTMPREAETRLPLDPTPLVEQAHAAGARICLDSSAPTIRRWISSGFPPDLIKPNIHELAATVGRTLLTIGDAVEAAQELVAQGVETVLASAGEDGAIVVTKSTTLWARSPRATVLNTTGAGDAALAGFLSRWTGDDPDGLEEALRRAVSWGYLAVSEMTSVLSEFRLVDGIESGSPPLSRPLTSEA